MCIIDKGGQEVRSGALSGPATVTSWDRFLEAQPERLVLWIALAMVLVAVAVYVIGKVRAASVQQERNAGELLSKFRELHRRGDLSDEEYRTIKTALASRLQEELNDNGETG